MRYTENYEVTCHDVDVNNNIKPSLILRYMQETANHQMRDRKPSYYDLFFAGKSFIVTRVTIEIFAQLHQYDKIQVDTWNCPAKGVTFLRCYEIRRGDETVARAYSVWAVTDHETGKSSAGVGGRYLQLRNRGRPGHDFADQVPAAAGQGIHQSG